VSSQLGPTQRAFRTTYPILSGPNNLDYANNIGQVTVTINGAKTWPEYVNGEKGLIMLSRATNTGDVVLVSYYHRRAAPPGIYMIDFTEDNQFTVSPIFIIEGEIIADPTTGTETTISLANQNIEASSCVLYLTHTGSYPIYLLENTDYTVNLVTGVVTFLQPVPKNYTLKADYRYQPTGYYNGPYTFEPYQENHTAITGIVVSIGRRAKKGDMMAVVVSQNREQQARIYGGHWQMSMEFTVIAKDPIQMEEMADHLITYLWSIRKNSLETEGLTLMSVEPSGETEEMHIDLTGDLYYETAISVAVQTEWQEFVPYLYKINRIIPELDRIPDTKNYIVNKDYSVAYSLEPDTVPVIKYPLRGYEKLG